MGRKTLILKLIVALNPKFLILVCQVVHVGLRYTSLDYLRFPELNQKRACLLVAAHASGEPVPGALYGLGCKA